MSVSSAKHLPEVQTEKKKSVVHTPQFLSARSSTCPRFRPEKLKSAVLSTISVNSAQHLPEVQTRKKKCDPLSTISVSSAWHLPEVQTRKKMQSTLHNFCHLRLAPARGSDPKKKEVPSTFHNFCQLGQAPARGSDPNKKSAVHSSQFLSARHGTCPRFRPAKREVRSTLHNSSSAKHLPEVQTRKKEKCGPLSTISVSSAKHLPEVQTRTKKVRSTLHNFCQLGLAPARGLDPQKEKCDPLSTIPARPSTYPRFRPEKKKSAVHSPQFLSTQLSTCPRFRHQKKCGPLSTISVSSA